MGGIVTASGSIIPPQQNLRGKLFLKQKSKSNGVLLTGYPLETSSR